MGQGNCVCMVAAGPENYVFPSHHTSNRPSSSLTHPTSHRGSVSQMPSLTWASKCSLSLNLRRERLVRASEHERRCPHVTISNCLLQKLWPCSAAGQVSACMAIHYCSSQGSHTSQLLPWALTAGVKEPNFLSGDSESSWSGTGGAGSANSLGIRSIHLFSPSVLCST